MTRPLPSTALVVTTPATTRALPDLRQRLLGALQFHFEQVHHVSATNPGQVRQNFTSPQPYVIIAAGGDGTVNLALRSLRSQDSLCVLPVGTANDLARSMGMPILKRRSLRSPSCLGFGTEHQVDILSVNGYRFCTCGGVGIPAAVAERVNTLRRTSGILRGLGNSIYVALGAERALVNPKPLDLFIEWEDEHGCTQQRRFHTPGVFVTNQSRVAGKLTIAEGASNCDGTFELVVLPAGGRRTLLGELVRFRLGLPGRSAALHFRARRARLTSSEVIPFFGDGETLLRATQFDVCIEPRALNLWCCNRSAARHGTYL